MAADDETREEEFRPEHFRRDDESADAQFYAAPRLVAHIDDAARAALTEFYDQTLAPGGDVLDLMASRFSHLPALASYRQVVGLGMNAVELAANRQLTAALVHDLNRIPRLPFADRSFDAVLISVSVQYLIQPVAVFAGIARVLRPGGKVVVSYSSRLFPTKAVAIWRALGDAERAQLLGRYIELAGGFGPAHARDLAPRSGRPADPLYVVWARRRTPPAPPDAVADDPA